MDGLVGIVKYAENEKDIAESCQQEDYTDAICL